jgi:hypothetical protein
MVGAALPVGVKFDGQDISAALLGKGLTRQTRIFWEYGRNTNSFAYPRKVYHRSPSLAVREGPWKLLLADANGKGAQLYDVVADPRETRNLADEKPVLAERLRRALIDWRESWP